MTPEHSRSHLVLAALAAMLALPVPLAKARPGSSSGQYPSQVASVWFDQLYDVIALENTAPPPAARIYGVTAVALYEAVVRGSEQQRSLVGQLADLAPLPDVPAGLHWPTVANAAMAATIRGVFITLRSETLARLNALEESFNARFKADTKQSEFVDSVAYGRNVAQAILEWAASDGFAALNNSPYESAPVHGAWQITPSGTNPKPLQASWGRLRPMVLKGGADCAPAGHPEFSTDPGSGFYAAARRVYEVSQNLTSEQKTIAYYWADGAGTGTPPGHWMAIVGQLARRDGLSLMAAAEAYAKVGITVHDAFIACWHVKFTTNLQRPVTFINAHIAPDWRPLIVTPMFPSYPSGHATVSGAAAEMLTEVFGERSFTDTTCTDHRPVKSANPLAVPTVPLNVPPPPVVPRTFASFHAAASEAALSRLYGGIHYAFDNDDGLASGRCIGRSIASALKLKKESAASLSASR